MTGLITEDDMKDAALESLRKFVLVSPRLPGDLDIADIMAEYKITKRQAAGLVERAVASGRWVSVWVRGDNGVGKKKVIREITGETLEPAGSGESSQD